MAVAVRDGTERDRARALERDGRAAGDQLWREEEDLHRVALAVLDPLDEQPGGLGANLGVREPDGGQRRVQSVDERHVVEADHRHVLRAAPVELVKRAVAADREHVVGGYDRGEVVGGLE
jgi:hypothetical protein